MQLAKLDWNHAFWGRVPRGLKFHPTQHYGWMHFWCCIGNFEMATEFQCNDAFGYESIEFSVRREAVYNVWVEAVCGRVCVCVCVCV